MITVFSSGCSYLGQNSYNDIVKQPSVGWSSPENLTMIMGAGNHNLRDFRTNIKAIVTPYYPSVIKAIGRRTQVQSHWSENEFQGYVDHLLEESSGLYIDWEDSGEPLYNNRLEPIHSPLQFDSLLLLLTLKNTAWPPGKVMLVPRMTSVGMQNDIIALDDPHYIAPDITHLEGNLFLVNEKDLFITPITVWGRKMNYLTDTEETLFLKFKLRTEGHHFLDGSNKYFLVIKGIESDIKLELSTDFMK